MSFRISPLLLIAALGICSITAASAQSTDSEPSVAADSAVDAKADTSQSSTAQSSTAQSDQLPGLDDPEFAAMEAEAAKELEEKLLAMVQEIESGPEPMMDFAGIFDKDKNVVGTVSMIDGNQVVKSLKGIIFEATGKLRYRATTEKGLYMNFSYDRDGTDANAGFNFEHLDLELIPGAEFGDPVKFHVHDIKLLDNVFDYAYQPDGAEEVQGFKTTYEDFKICDGDLYFTVLNLMEGQEKQVYRGVLAGALVGYMDPIETADIPDCSGKS